MSRNVNIEEVLFDVWEDRIYLKDKNAPIQGYKAILGRPEPNKLRVFSVVSDNYLLVTNKEAIKLAKSIHLNLFPSTDIDSFEIFNVVAPMTKSYCFIDFIDRNYTLNVWKEEVYVPFIRIHNSYNKSRSLKFDIGFCRKLCDNGVIFEQEVIVLKYSHSKKGANPRDLKNINTKLLKKYELDFIEKIGTAIKLKIPTKYFVPLSAKILDINFKIEESDAVKKRKILHRMETFKKSISQLTEVYIDKEELGETAYALFNVITDYISNDPIIPDIQRHSMQRKCGVWLNKLKTTIDRDGFSWEEELKDYSYLLTK